MSLYTDQQSRLVSAFCHRSTLCVCDCSCGRVYFVSAQGHGDYEEGELAELQKKAREQPNRYIEEAIYDSVDLVEIDGKSVVPHCVCGVADKYARWIEDHAEGLAQYLTRYFQEKKKQAERVATTAGRINEELTAAIAQPKEPI
jgi:hypothetical protein